MKETGTAYTSITSVIIIKQW